MREQGPLVKHMLASRLCHVVMSVVMSNTLPVMLCARVPIMPALLRACHVKVMTGAVL